MHTCIKNNYCFHWDTSGYLSRYTYVSLIQLVKERQRQRVRADHQAYTYLTLLKGRKLLSFFSFSFFCSGMNLCM